MTTQTRVKVAKYSDLPVRNGVAITVGSEKIALYKVTSGEVYAIADKSPHPKGGVLSEGLVSGHYVFCPVYDWKISLADGQVQAPDQGQVKTYEVEIERDEVFLRL
ncbi:nitrite reductase small subunit NirD [Aquibacillus koreensis]|uniref:Nitrite reductase small subunit NirD n=1 Tax=Aquibacillus koreensis TaxID=279446 RepID=A0A9X4AGT5_9BACI|nr:nitrite reductase small subunit NirD [Aquibacillus koreensis]MCT2536505.1 nitrite reductase small subunit NirD [Aquibacillus koreensis]MDC3419407.1 nitrite reductase small subunit NirD [Aquibacillus koreensis]